MLIDGWFITNIDLKDCYYAVGIARDPRKVVFMKLTTSHSTCLLQIVPSPIFWNLQQELSDYKTITKI